MKTRVFSYMEKLSRLMHLQAISRLTRLANLILIFRLLMQRTGMLQKTRQHLSLLVIAHSPLQPVTLRSKILIFGY